MGIVRILGRRDDGQQSGNRKKRPGHQPGPVAGLEFERNTRHKIGWFLWSAVVIPISFVGQVIGFQ